MDRLPPSEPDQLLWRETVATHHAYVQARMRLFSDSADLLAIVHAGLDAPTQRGAALEIAALLGEEDRKQLLPDLLSLATFVHGFTEAARNVVLSLPRDWLAETLPRHTESILARGDQEEYRGMLEVYRRVAPRAALRLARRAAAAVDADLQEVGQEYIPIILEDIARSRANQHL